jgi:TetR/AcrR family transcriptional regulator, regulator of cefoperazone and chloramphenicol sensitivity
MSQDYFVSPALKTQERLLITASRIFAEKGYQDTTIAEICEQAQTNIASVNYHFKDKKNLYLQAWRYAYQQDLKNHPPDGGIAETTSAEQRLGGRICSLIARIADPDSYSFAIVHKEMTLQSNLLEEIMEQEINPERLAMTRLIAELLGENASQKQIQFCHASVISQCFHLLHIKQLKVSEATRDYMMGLNDTALYANHVVAFSLAGIKAIREQNHA